MAGKRRVRRPRGVLGNDGSGVADGARKDVAEAGEPGREGDPPTQGPKAAWLEAARSVARRVLFPPGFVIALAAPAICAMMAWVFLLGNEGSPLSCVAYVASAYLFTVLVIWAVRRFPREDVRGLMRQNPLGGRLVDAKCRRRISAASGLATDACWAVANLVGGVCFASVWLITLGAYYLVFALMRGALLLCMRPRGAGFGPDVRGIERLCGVLLLLSTFVLSGIVCLVMLGEGTFAYEGVLIYAVALFAFCSLTTAVVNYARRRRHPDTLEVLSCRVNLAVALVSMFALEVAMLAEFGTAADTGLCLVMPALTGACIAAALVAMGVRSIVEAGRRTGAEGHESPELG